MDAVAAIAGVVEKLFGKVGAALLLATGVFFLCPSRILGAVGIDNTDHDMRRTLGFLLLFSLASCAVTVTLAAWSFVSAKLPRWWEARLTYKRLSKEARVVLVQMETLGDSSVVLSIDNPAAQELIDARLLRIGSRLHGFLELVKTENYRDFVSRYRIKLRTLLTAEDIDTTHLLRAVRDAERFKRLNKVLTEDKGDIGR